MLNKAMIIGRLGKDPEVRYTTGGSPVANFSVATTERYNDKSGQRQERTEWHNVVLFARLAEVAQQYVKKGQLIYIEGRIQTRSWEDRDGNKRYTTEIVGNNMQMLTPKGGGSGDTTAMPAGPVAAEPAPGPEPDAAQPPADDDLPF